MRSKTAVLLFLPLLGLGMFLVYLGMILGKSIILLSLYFIGDYMGWLPVTPDTTNEVEAMIIVLLILFGLILARLSAVGAKDKPTTVNVMSKGLLSCMIAGMTVGVSRLFPFPDGPIAKDVVEYLLLLAKHEWSILAIGLGIMLYYFSSAALRKGD